MVKTENIYTRKVKLVANPNSSINGLFNSHFHHAILKLQAVWQYIENFSVFMIEIIACYYSLIR